METVRLIKSSISCILLIVFALGGCRSSPEQSIEKPEAKNPGTVHFEPASVSEQVKDTGDLPRILERGMLRILVPPRTEQTLRRPESDVSLERDLARHFAERFEVDAQIVEVGAYEELLPELLAGRGDIVAGQMTVTEARAKEVTFTRPVGTVSEVVVGPLTEGMPTTPAELNGLEIHVPVDSSYLQSLETLRADVAPELKVVQVPKADIEELAYDVSRGARPLTVLDSNRLETIETYNEDLQRLFPVSDGRQLAWAVRPDNPKLAAAANAFLVEAALTSHAQKRSLGDLKAMEERGSIRLLTRNNAVNYYLHRGQTLGFDYELAKLFAESKGLRLEVVIPPSRDRLIPYLLEGKGDFIAASLTVTPERKKSVSFSDPYLFVDELLVQRTDESKAINTPADLKGRTITVRESSSYFETLKGLRERFGFSLESASEELETETLIARVASGQLDLTVADTHIFAVQRLLYPNVGGALALAKLQEEGSTDWTLDGRPGDKGSKSIAFAVRPDSSNLRSALNRFVKSHFRGLEYNMLRNRYFGNKKRAAQAS
ncbi:MAG: transporter substrate-binding domain-containing protein, partial [Myxococcota bacterium]